MPLVLTTHTIKKNLTKKLTKTELLVIKSSTISLINNSQFLQLNGIQDLKWISNYYKNLQMKNTKKPKKIVKKLWNQQNIKCSKL